MTLGAPSHHPDTAGNTAQPKWKYAKTDTGSMIMDAWKHAAGAHQIDCSCDAAVVGNELQINSLTKNVALPGPAGETTNTTNETVLENLAISLEGFSEKAIQSLQNEQPKVGEVMLEKNQKYYVLQYSTVTLVISQVFDETAEQVTDDDTGKPNIQFPGTPNPPVEAPGTPGSGTPIQA